MGMDISDLPLIIQTEKQRLGYMALSLSNWGTSGIPQIVGNVEVAGALYSFDSLESIGNWSGVSAGTVYIKLVVSGSSITAQWTSVAPSWSAEKQGWYSPTSGEENQRYVFQATKVDASNVTGKARMPSYKAAIRALLSLNSGKIQNTDWAEGIAGTYTYLSLGIDVSWVVPAGLYFVLSNRGASYLEIYDGSAWRNYSDLKESPGLILSDGVNYRITPIAGNYNYVWYRKLM